jgi:hypothetical protein
MKTHLLCKAECHRCFWSLSVAGDVHKALQFCCFFFSLFLSCLLWDSSIFKWLHCKLRMHANKKNLKLYFRSLISLPLDFLDNLIRPYISHWLTRTGQKSPLFEISSNFICFANTFLKIVWQFKLSFKLNTS